MRLSGNPPDVPADRPLLVYLNHPSWWDPITCIVLARTLFPARRHFGPIDARGLAKYRILERLGLFPLELDTHRGSTEFLRKSRLILSNGGNALWVTAEGEFRDPRRRPVRLRPGVAHLARRLAGGSILPLAIEYPFWQERTPEALVRFGPPIGPSELRELTAAECNRRLEATLTETQDALADDAASRDTARFRTIVAGRAGVGGIYDLWRRARAVLTGKKFVEEHAG